MVAASEQAHADVVREQAEATAALKTARTRLQTIETELEASRDDLDHLLVYGSSKFGYWERQVARGRPGDIVDDGSSEAGRSLQLTAAMVRRAAQMRDEQIATLLAEEAKKRGQRKATDLVAAEDALLRERAELREALALGTPPVARPTSQFRKYLEEFQALCREHGADLVVVALPIDVQVDPAEWTKYGVQNAPAMEDSLILLDDVMADAKDLGMRGLNATQALRGAQPGAFLDHDIHMTARGHAALAEALATTLATPVEIPVAAPKPGLPPGLTFVPTDREWDAIREVVVKGSTAAGCTTQLAGTWLRVQCRRAKPSDRFDGLVVGTGATPATMAMHSRDALALVTPLTPGTPLTARFFRKAGPLDLEITWRADDGGEPQFSGVFVKAEDASPPRPVAAAVTALCEIYAEKTGEHVCADAGNPKDYDSESTGCEPGCVNLWGDPKLVDACTKTYPNAFPDRLACLQNDPLFAPACPDAQVHAFASNACFALCAEHLPCATGVCTPWQDGHVCVEAPAT